MIFTNLSSSTFGQSTYLSLFSLLVCVSVKRLYHELSDRQTKLIGQTQPAMADLLRGRPQGEVSNRFLSTLCSLITANVLKRFSISAGWNTHFKQFDRKHLRGFKRPGTLCFRNVAILLLLHTSSIFNWLHVHMEWHNPDCPTPQECVLCLLYELFEAYWSEDRARKGHERWIFALWEIVVRYFPDFKNGQHDASEFLETMLKMLYGSTDKQQ